MYRHHHRGRAFLFASLVGIIAAIAKLIA